MQTRHLVASLLLAGIVVPAPTEAQTNGFVLHCLSARAAGMGCVTRSRDDVPTDLFRDPASIGWHDRAALEVNLSAFVPSLTFRNSANPRWNDGARHAYPLGSMAWVAPRPSRRISWALGMEPIGGFGSDFKLRHDLLGTGQDYESFFAALKAGPAVSVEVAPGLNIGASAYATYAQIRDFRMPFTMPPSAAAGMGLIMQMDEHYPAMFANVTELTAYGDSRDFAGWGFGTSVGVSYRAGDSFRASASWSPRSKITLDGGAATIDMSRQFEAMFGAMVQERMQYHGLNAGDAQASVAQALTQAGMNLSLGAAARYSAATELSEPQTAGVGMTFRPAARWNVSLEGVWMDWSAAESIMPYRLTSGSNPNVNILVNGDPGNSSFTYPFPLYWKDSWTGKAGLEFEVSGATRVRGGYLHGTNPVPDNTVFIAFPAIATQALTAGIGFQLLGIPLEVSVVQALDTRIDGSREGHRLGKEYEGSRTSMRQTVVTLGAVWRY